MSSWMPFKPVLADPDRPTPMWFTAEIHADLPVNRDRPTRFEFWRPVRSTPLRGSPLAWACSGPRASILLFIRLNPMAATPSRQALRRWGNSLGIRLPASIAREAQLQVDQAVELSVVEGGVMIRPVQHRLSLAERLEAYEPMAGEPTEAMAFRPVGAEVIE